ncbi:MAG: aminoglycoside phosphotransferase [Anaerolineaceae bacterium]|nr:aminoglycoside phosphotransferase [Anaerolineaceae bacterium]
MDEELGAPIAYGRTAEIYAWDDGHILKLFHDWFGRESIEYEAKIGQAVHASGLPVPAVGEIVVVNGRTGLIYERFAGVALWELMPQKPWTIFRYARRMAALHAEMHANPLQLEIPDQRQRLVRKLNQAQVLSEALRDKTLAALETMPDGTAICHGDFHPGNVLATPQGEVVIDWIDATRGNPLADLARSSILALAAAATTQTQNVLEKLMVRLFHAVYLRHYFTLRPGGRVEYGRWLPIVAAARLSENIPEIEQWLLAQAERSLPK